MTASVSRMGRWLRIPLVVAFGVLLSAGARAATVTGTFTFAKFTADATTTIKRPIAFAHVEIYTKGNGTFDTWGLAGTTTTDANGAISFTDPVCHMGSYDVRIYAQNYAAIVIPIDQVVNNGAFSTEPGRPGAVINKTPSSCNATLDFSFDFSDLYNSEHFNIAEAARRGFDYASMHRDPRETDPLGQAVFQPSTVSFSWYNSTVDQVVINRGAAFDDPAVVHEYGHWLERHLSTFAPIPASHGGCAATLSVPGGPPGPTINTPEQAWMEGFADYFAGVVFASLPPGTLIQAILPGEMGGTAAPSIMETPPPCSLVGTQAGTPGDTWTITASAIEFNVAAILWDLYDTGTNESFDVSSGQDTAIFQILDRELSQLPGNPKIEDFYCAWVGRGLPARTLDLLFAERGIPLPTCSGFAERLVWRPSTGEWLASSDTSAPMVDQASTTAMESRTSRSSAPRPESGGSRAAWAPTSCRCGAAPATFPCRPTTTTTAGRTWRSGVRRRAPGSSCRARPAIASSSSESRATFRCLETTTATGRSTSQYGIPGRSGVRRQAPPSRRTDCGPC